MAFVHLHDFVYDCYQCSNRCDGVSKGVYQFKHDAAFSEQYEQMIISRINRTGRYKASKCKMDGYPDVEVRDENNALKSYIEVKVQQRAFMQVEKYLPHAGLFPSEIVALNESDLLRYFNLERQLNVSTIIVWVLLSRPCVIAAGSYALYYQHLPQLKKIHQRCGASRRFRRKSGEGDVVNGVHKGVTVNYHFSLAELVQWK